MNIKMTILLVTMSKMKETVYFENKVVHHIIHVMLMLMPTSCTLKTMFLIIFCVCDDGDGDTNPLADVFCLFADGLWI